MLFAAACIPADAGLVPDADSVEPMVRVGLVVGDAPLTVGGGNGVLLSSGDGGGLTPVAAGSSVQVVGGPGGIRLRQSKLGSSGSVSITARSQETAGFVRINGRDYRGEVTVIPVPNGLLAVNVLPLEAYVAGVVNVEMGRRPPSENEAVYAQAVVSRTFTLRMLGRYRVRGYDVLSTVSDQAYGGVSAETQAGWDAVNKTRGEVVTYDTQLAEVYFHSTCGGRTASVEEAFGGAPFPYLRSILDRSPAGEAYCGSSPRFRWTEQWSGEAAGRTLRETAPLAGANAGSLAQVSDLQIIRRSATNRVSELVILARQAPAVSVVGEQIIRQVLRPAQVPMLRSANFSLVVTKAGGRILSLRADGSGSGHGVGMCQWGAVGRARAGASYREILSAYFPGTEVKRWY
ncbi:MAG: SpoIID/LytB domain-containing protein [Gemmatimonadota bacterium]